MAARLSDLAFESEFDELPFDPEGQIGPCSVDLRLSGVYWTRNRLQYRREVIDLEHSRIMDTDPHRGWQRHSCSPGDKITLRPGEMILGRVAERFVMPSDCAGAIEGRSSYARLGISVHTSGGFINPGWRGHMPLTIVNHSSVPVRVPVGVPLCQLMVVQLRDRPLADYADRMDRKYVNDIGGPSYWWRDRLMKELRNAMDAKPIDHKVFDEIDDLLLEWSDESMIPRLERFIAEIKQQDFGNADELLDQFAVKERRTKTRRDLAEFAATWGWTVALVALGAVVLNSTWWPARVFAGALMGASVIAVGWALRQPDRDYLTAERLQRVRRGRPTR